MDTSMRMNRTLVYAGVFLVALGVALFVVDQRPFAMDSIVAVLRLWPLALIAIGAGIALRRTQFAMASGLIAAAVPGLLLGLTMAALVLIHIGAALRHHFLLRDRVLIRMLPRRGHNG